MSICKENEFIRLFEECITNNYLKNLYLDLISNLNRFHYIKNFTVSGTKYSEFHAEYISTKIDRSYLIGFPYKCSIDMVSDRITLKYVKNNKNNYIMKVILQKHDSVYYDPEKGEGGLSYYNKYEKKRFEFILNEDLSLFQENKQGKLVPATLSSLSYIKDKMNNDNINGLIDSILKYFANLHILFKDIYKENKQKPIFLPITINEIWNYYNKRDLIQAHCKKGYVPKSINCYSLHLGYLLVKCQRYVDKKDCPKLFILNDVFEKIHFPYSIFSQIKKMFFYYYKIKIKNIADEYILEDYVDMVWKYQKPKLYNLKISSYNRIVDEHDNLSNLLYIKNTPTIKIPRNSKFNDLKLPNDFEKIKTKKRLVKETAMQKHCVWSYAQRINQDKCVIYSTVFKGNRFTIEIIKRNKKYKLKQIRGRNNSPAPQELIDIVKVSM